VDVGMNVGNMSEEGVSGCEGGSHRDVWGSVCGTMVLYLHGPISTWSYIYMVYVLSYLIPRQARIRNAPFHPVL
jgi:hypothetical protein